MTLGVGVGCVAPGFAQAQRRYWITVDAEAPRIEVSPLLYGVAIEDINHAVEGGLYAEMVENRDFEVTNLPGGARWSQNQLRTRSGWFERKWFGNELSGWEMAADGETVGSIHLEKYESLNEQNPHSMKLAVREVGGRAGVANSGFRGMRFDDGAWYDLSFFARTENDETFDITVTLESAGGESVYSTTVVEGVGGAWEQYEVSLRPEVPGGLDGKGRLVLSIDRPGVIWFDVVSLFPRDTYKERENGLRRELVEMIAALHPAFVRFPGGATVGGLTLDNRIQWKNSIGPLERRRGTMNLWGYYTTNGLGFHEYLQLCEDLGAAAVWVCNPGFSDDRRNPEIAKPQQVDEYVREALDAIEYAIGPVDSQWGAKRAENGHPEPFPLMYVQVGNEALGEKYAQHYEKFYEAIRAQYPQITVVSDVWLGDEMPVDLYDEHRYGDPDEIIDGYLKYDDDDRDGPKAMVGAFGCNDRVGEGNLTAALAEAIFMLGFERNADIVVMSAYAPLLFHVDDRQWPTGLIGFDGARAYGRTSYYVQEMFASNRPDLSLRTQVESDATKPERRVIFASAGYKEEAGEVVVKVVNRDTKPHDVEFRLTGVEQVGSDGRAITLSDDDPGVENSLYDPQRIVPAESAFEVAGPTFTYPLKANSVTVLRFPGRLAER